MGIFGLFAVVAFLVSVLGFVGAAVGTRRKWHGTAVLGTFAGTTFLLLGLLAGTFAVGTYGYRSLTREEVVATVTAERLRGTTFFARFGFATGDTLTFTLEGDELYVDAHILKWKPFINLLGLHTHYELDRIAGRYFDLEDERNKPRTVYSLAAPKPFDLFDVVRKRPVLIPIVDAEYGSASFVPAEGTYELRVSTTGLLFRPVDD